MVATSLLISTTFHRSRMIIALICLFNLHSVYNDNIYSICLKGNEISERVINVCLGMLDFLISPLLMILALMKFKIQTKYALE